MGTNEDNQSDIDWLLSNDHEDKHNLLRPAFPTFVWNFTQQMVGKRYKKGMAGQVFALYRKLILNRAKDVDLETYRWETIQPLVNDRLTLDLAVCVALVCKMNSKHCKLSLTVLKKNLRKLEDCTYTVKQLKEAEAEVFRELEYQVPLWTNVQKAEMLANSLDITGITFETVSHIMDIAEFHQDTIECAVNKLVNGESPGEFTHVHLSDPLLEAGAVAAAAKITRYKKEDLLSQLALHANSTTEFIATIAYVMVKCFSKEASASKNKS